MKPIIDRLKEQTEEYVKRLEEDAKVHDKLKADALAEKGFVRIVRKESILNYNHTGALIQQQALVHGVLAETQQYYWVPKWFYMALYKIAQEVTRSDEERVRTEAKRVMEDARYRQAMEATYVLQFGSSIWPPQT